MTYLDVSADSVIILSLALCLELEWCSIDIQNNGSSVVCSFEKKKKPGYSPVLWEMDPPEG